MGHTYSTISEWNPKPSPDKGARHLAGQPVVQHEAHSERAGDQVQVVARRQPQRVRGARQLQGGRRVRAADLANKFRLSCYSRWPIDAWRSEVYDARLSHRPQGRPRSAHVPETSVLLPEMTCTNVAADALQQLRCAAAAAGHAAGTAAAGTLASHRSRWIHPDCMQALRS